MRACLLVDWSSSPIMLTLTAEHADALTLTILRVDTSSCSAFQVNTSLCSAVQVNTSSCSAVKVNTSSCSAVKLNQYVTMLSGQYVIMLSGHQSVREVYLRFNFDEIRSISLKLGTFSCTFRSCCLNTCRHASLLMSTRNGASR